MLLFPCPEIVQVRRYHVSLLLTIFLVSVHFLVEINKIPQPDFNFSEAQSKAYFNMQAKLYQRHLAELKKFKNKDQRLIASVMESDSEDTDKVFSSLSRASLLDSTFKPLEVSNLGLDQIEYQDWHEVHSTMRQSLTLGPAYLLGINDSNYGWDRWLSYMFVHIGPLHILSNAIFLFLFGALIETLFGGIVVTLVFFGSGFLAAPIYMYLTDLTQVSLVGASGGVCGLIAFYAIYQMNIQMRYFYWVLPFEKYYGFMTLSSGYLLLLWILGDLAGYFSGVAFLDSVAYAAHLGGFLVGALCALGLKFSEMFYKKSQNQPY